MNTPEETSPAKESENTVPEETSPDVKAVFGNEEESLTGQDNAAERRDQFARQAGLPCGMTPNAFLSAIGILYTKPEAEKIVRTIEETAD